MSPAANGARRNGFAPAPALVAHCPRCGERYAAGAFVQEYWTSDRRVFTCWCASCRFVCEIVPVDRVLSYEPEH